MRKDLEEGKITLPLIYLLQDTGTEETEEIVKILKSDTMTETDLAYVLHLFHQHNTIEKSFNKAKELLNEAKSELDRFEDSMAKQSLLTIADYVVTRKK